MTSILCSIVVAGITILATTWLMHLAAAQYAHDLVGVMVR